MTVATCQFCGPIEIEVNEPVTEHNLAESGTFDALAAHVHTEGHQAMEQLAAELDASVG